MPKNVLRVLAFFITIFLVFSVLPINKILSGESNPIFKIEETISDAQFDATTILVKYKNIDEFKSIKIKDFDSYVAQSLEDKDFVKKVIKDFSVQEDIEVVQPNYVYSLDDWEIVSGNPEPNQFNELLHWYYDQADLQEAWKKMGCPDAVLCGGSSEVIVAVIDSGLAFENFDDTTGLTEANFKASPIFKNINIYTNEDEEPNNQRDDDCNGYVDDYNGADVYTHVDLNIQDTCDINDRPRLFTKSQSKSGHPVDTYGHGTYVTGLIASDILATGNTTISPAFNVSIMPISANKLFDEYFTTQTVVEGIEYATQEGADIITLSLTTSFKDSLLDKAIQNAYQEGVLVVAAAGNTNSTAPAYPASYDNVLSVGSINADNNRSSYSSYGNNIDVVAYVGDGSTPNRSSVYQQTLSCFGNCDKNKINDGFTNYNFIGTSFAAPQVAALAAMIKSQNPNLQPDDLMNRIIDTVIDIGPSGKDSETGYGVINYEMALFDEVVITPSEDTKPVYRFFSPIFGTHFYTTSEIEKTDLIFNKSDYWTFEGTAYNVYDDTAKGKPVYRFWSGAYATHFFTSNESEKSEIALKYSSEIWNFEGVAFNIPSSPVAGSIPVYRFWSPSNSRHFFTTNENEKNNLINNFDDTIWSYEGVAFYAFPVNN
ncbi:S8 family serine peptidase [Candidatus Dojkabacteria bacterium]|uniref:S8 family serine peptidase n=1 Tax=Candidatus Dojkabacteria bacterium TaxID=2099670 RepID=A0A955RLM7_9BACT|nr:S8 family serine peptidase [Candidatus Dojkabacteria bacterium]